MEIEVKEKPVTLEVLVLYEVMVADEKGIVKGIHVLLASGVSVIREESKVPDDSALLDEPPYSMTLRYEALRTSVK